MVSFIEMIGTFSKMEMLFIFLLITGALFFFIWILLRINNVKDQVFYMRWTRTIDRTYRDIRKHQRTVERPESYRRAYAELATILAIETGDIQDFLFMSAGKQRAWIYLLTVHNRHTS